MFNYYVSANDQVLGPYTEGQIASMWNSGRFDANTMICAEGTEDWESLRAHPMVAAGSGSIHGGAIQPQSESRQMIEWQEQKEINEVVKLNNGAKQVINWTLILAAIPVFNLFAWWLIFLPCLALLVIGIVLVCKSEVRHGLNALAWGLIVLPIAAVLVGLTSYFVLSALMAAFS